MQNETRRIEEKDIDPIEFINLGDITKEQKEEQSDESCEIVNVNLNICGTCDLETDEYGACESCLISEEETNKKVEQESFKFSTAAKIFIPKQPFHLQRVGKIS